MFSIGNLLSQYKVKITKNIKIYDFILNFS
jgi:hypothetical protein